TFTSVSVAASVYLASLVLVFSTASASPAISTLSLHDALPISVRSGAYLGPGVVVMPPAYVNVGAWVGEGTMIDSHALVGSCAQRSEEHTSELQSRVDLVCRLLLEKKNRQQGSSTRR